MASFTEEIKNEITSAIPQDAACARALLCAFLKTSGSFVVRNGVFGFEVVTENEKTAEFITDLLENSYNLAVNVSGAKFDLLSGRDKLAFECVSEKSHNFLIETGILSCDGKNLVFGIDEKIISKQKCKTAFLKGAFLGGGSCTLPGESTYSRTGYHFEIVFPNSLAANDLCEMLCDFEVLAKHVTRKENAVVYVKSKEVISDLLNIMDCKLSLAKLNKIVEHKDRQNNANRVNNCSVSNIDKTVTASVKQVKGIEIIAQTIGLQSLEKPLFDVAECRLADKNASMQELAQRLNISKSCINHRMRKILELSETLGD